MRPRRSRRAGRLKQAPMRNLIGELLIRAGWWLTGRKRWQGPFFAQDAAGEVWQVWVPGWDAIDPEDDMDRLKHVRDAIDRHREFELPRGWQCLPFGRWDGTDEIQY